MDNVKDEGGLVLFFSGTLIGLLVATFFAINPGPSTEVSGKPALDDHGPPKLEFKSFYPNLYKLASYEPAAESYLSVVQEAVQKHASTYELDPLLVLALIKKESAFNLRVISSAGAAGPMQFMPRTGIAMGLDPVYSPEILDRADRLRDRAGSLYTRAVRNMKTERYDPLPTLIERWKNVNTQSRELYQQYRRKLKKKIRNKSTEEIAAVDQRFLRDKAVMSGVKYLAQLFEERNGDVREALAAYNAGPSSVRRYGGIPPYNQTVRYQNRIVNTYQRYRQYLNPGLRDSERQPALSMMN